MSSASQAEDLKKRLTRSKGELTIEGLKKNLATPGFHGKKVDVPISWINISDNHRSRLDDIDSLKLQILEVGLAQPIGIQLLDDQITIVYGHRRYTAFKELAEDDPRRFSKISCIIQVYDQPEQGRIITQAIENLGRSDLLPLDECVAINELKQTLKTKNGGSYNNTQLGDFLGGIHRKTVDLAIIIANWPQNVHDYIRQNDEISISQLRAAAKKGLKGDEIIVALKADSKLSKKGAIKKNFPQPLSHSEYAKFKEFVASSSDLFEEDIQKFLLQQKKWLGSSQHRSAISYLLKELFKET